MWCQEEEGGGGGKEGGSKQAVRHTAVHKFEKKKEKGVPLNRVEESRGERREEKKGRQGGGGGNEEHGRIYTMEKKYTKKRNGLYKRVEVVLALPGCETLWSLFCFSLLFILLLSCTSIV